MWKIVRKTSVAGLIGGAILGSLYGAAFVVVLIFRTATERSQIDLFIAQSFLCLPIGLIVGLPLGAVLGLPIGIFNGWVIGLTTPVDRDKILAPLACTVVSAIGTLIGLPMLFQIIAPGVPLETLFVVIPAFIAGGFGLWLSLAIVNAVEALE